MYILLFFLVLPLILYPNSLNQDKILHLNKIDNKILVDGIIDDQWIKADSISDFVQFQPYNATKPSKKTTCKIVTTEESLFCLIIAYDQESNIQNFTGQLDDFQGDVVSIMLDTFDDNRTAYKFAVSASGVRSDARMLDDARNRDYNWDGIWYADSKIYSWGFVVEIEIPYKSIQYNQKLTEWGLDFDRWRPIDSEDIYWCTYEENEGQRISKFGKLVLGDFVPSIKGLNLEIFPVGLIKATYVREDIYKIDPNAGLDIFYNSCEGL